MLNIIYINNLFSKITYFFSFFSFLLLDIPKDDIDYGKAMAEESIQGGFLTECTLEYQVFKLVLDAGREGITSKVSLVYSLTRFVCSQLILK